MTPTDGSRDMIGPQSDRRKPYDLYCPKLRNAVRGKMFVHLPESSGTIVSRLLL